MTLTARGPHPRFRGVCSAATLQCPATLRSTHAGSRQAAWLSGRPWQLQRGRLPALLCGSQQPAHSGRTDATCASPPRRRQRFCSAPRPQALSRALNPQPPAPLPSAAWWCASPTAMWCARLPTPPWRATRSSAPPTGGGCLLGAGCWVRVLSLDAAGWARGWQRARARISVALAGQGRGS